MRPPIGSVDTSSAGTAATELIRAAIIEGHLKPGERLREADLAREMGISRTPVREALWTLNADGLVSLLPRRGAQVRVYTTHDIRERYECRAVVEGYAARRAASRITPEELLQLYESCGRFERFAPRQDVTALVNENMFFHTKIISVVRNTQLTAIAERLIEMPLVYKHFFWASKEQKVASDQDHRAIVEALDARDGKRAERRMQAHIREGAQALIAELKATEKNLDAEPLELWVGS